VVGGGWRVRVDNVGGVVVGWGGWLGGTPLLFFFNMVEISFPGFSFSRLWPFPTPFFRAGPFDVRPTKTPISHCLPFF